MKKYIDHPILVFFVNLLFTGIYSLAVFKNQSCLDWKFHTFIYLSFLCSFEIYYTSPHFVNYDRFVWILSVIIANVVIIYWGFSIPNHPDKIKIIIGMLIVSILMFVLRYIVRIIQKNI